MKKGDLTKDQHYELSKLLYIGNLMVDLARTKGGVLGNYEEIVDYILHFSEEAGLKDHVKFDKLSNRFFTHYVPPYQES